IWGGQTTGYFYVSAPVSTGANKTTVKWAMKLHGYFPYPTNYEVLVNNNEVSTKEIIYDSQVRLFLLRNFARLLEKFDSDNDGIADKARLSDGASLEITAQATWNLTGSPQSGSNTIFIQVQTPDPSTIITLQNIVVQDIQSNFAGLTAKTESDGSYSFLSLPLRLSSRLQVSASADNYQPSTYSAIGTFTAGQEITRNITLSPATVSTPPLPPANLSANPFSPSRIDLAWQDKSNTETGFEIQRSSSDSFSSPVSFTVIANTISYSDTALTENTTYYYRVASYNLVGRSAWSSVDSATTPQVPVSPARPLNLTATATSLSQIRLQWSDDSNNETGFRIERKIGLAGTYELLTNVSANSTSFLNTGITTGTTYYYRIRAYNIAGPSDWSNEASVAMPVAPTAPGNLSINLISSSRADLLWNDNSDNEDGFKIERKVAVSGIYSTIATSSVNTYTDSTLADGTVYYYRVWAYNIIGNSVTATNEATITTTLNAPSVLTATLGASLQVILAWSDNSFSEAGFKIERSTDGINYTLLNTLTTNTTHYTDSQLPAGAAYSYRVHSYNSAVGNSAYSNVVTVTIPPVAPSNLTASPVSASQINLTWTDNSDNETGFELHRSTDGTNYILRATLNADTTSYNDTGLSDGMRYYYRVFSFNTAAGKSTSSNIASAITTLIPPSLLKVDSFDYTKIDLSWSYASVNADGFSIERKTTATAYALLATLSANAISHTDNTVSANTSYTYRVRAYNNITQSVWSNESPQTTPPAPPSSASATPANALTGVSVTPTLSWGAVTGAASYDVYFGITTTGWSPVTT
ncbi:MAG: fibronectin type III domain-containing protein, partial [Planctomycetota bacterium]|nr:fibronectin type III domain-containing protein [Planctomycetota bacterium]